jgi:transposase InsO family protein
VTGFYWERHPDGPFATLIAVTATYCSPDADAEDYERLKRLAEREDDQRMRVFKEELRQALADPSQLPEDELNNAVEFTDESEAAFLRRLWRSRRTRLIRSGAGVRSRHGEAKFAHQCDCNDSFRG